MAAHKEYRAKWIEAGYDHDMGSAWVTLPPPPNQIRVYHFTTAEHAISDLALSRLKVARFVDCNDPFELLSLNFREHKLGGTVLAWRETQNRHTGFLSFSRNWIKPVLWSHYAAKHRGMCLGFNLLRNKIDEVKYEEKRIVKKLHEVGDDPTRLPDDLQDLLLHTKSADWDYEKEIRIFVQLANCQKEASLYFCSFSNELQLAEVILGVRCAVSLDTVRTLTAMHHPHAVVIKARTADKFFAVVPEEDTIP